MMQLTSLIKFSSVISFLGYRLHGIERLVATLSRVPSAELSNRGWRAVGTALAIAGLMTAGSETDHKGRSE